MGNALTSTTYDNEAPWEEGEAIWEWGFLRIYSITMFLGILVAFLSVFYFWRRQKYSMEILQVLIIIIVPTAILGARIWFLLSEVDNQGWSVWEDFFVFEGLSIQGGVMFSASSALIYLWTKRSIIDLRIAAGIILPCVLIGQSIGRWGNFSNHELYGSIVYDDTTLDWLTFIEPHMHIEDEYGYYYRQPLFLYESLLNLFAYIVIVWFVLRKNWVKPGTTGAMYFIWYGIVRWIMEPLRGDEDTIMKWGDVPISYLFSILWFSFGVVLFVYFELLTMAPNWVKRIVPPFMLSSKEYTKILPVKKRKLFWFGQKSDQKKRFLFWGKQVPNKIPIWVLKTNDKKWSKREINQGKRHAKKG